MKTNTLKLFIEPQESKEKRKLGPVKCDHQIDKHEINHNHFGIHREDVNEITTSMFKDTEQFQMIIENLEQGFYDYLKISKDEFNEIYDLEFKILNNEVNELFQIRGRTFYKDETRN
jgi:hypothetical protein